MSLAWGVVLLAFDLSRGTVRRLSARRFPVWAGAALLPLCLSGEVVAQQAGATTAPTPTIRLGDVCIPYHQTFFEVPILVTNEYLADGFYASIEYDNAMVGYAWYRLVDESWHVVSETKYANHHLTLEVRKNAPSRANGAEDDPRENTVLNVVFFSKDGNPEEAPFWVRTFLQLGSEYVPGRGGDSYFFEAGGPASLRPIRTRLLPGTVTVYFHDGVELGWGGITRTEQEFSLPL